MIGSDSFVGSGEGASSPAAAAAEMGCPLLAGNNNDKPTKVNKEDVELCQLCDDLKVRHGAPKLTPDLCDIGGI